MIWRTDETDVDIQRFHFAISCSQEEDGHLVTVHVTPKKFTLAKGEVQPVVVLGVICGSWSGKLTVLKTVEVRACRETTSLWHNIALRV